MDIGRAISVMISGRRVTRDGWNGKGMWLYYVPANSYPAQTEAARTEFGDMVPYRAYIAMRTAQGDVVPWLASQSDLLADDWSSIDPFLGDTKTADGEDFVFDGSEWVPLQEAMNRQYMIERRCYTSHTYPQGVDGGEG